MAGNNHNDVISKPIAKNKSFSALAASTGALALLASCGSAAPGGAQGQASRELSEVLALPVTIVNENGWEMCCLTLQRVYDKYGEYGPVLVRQTGEYVVSMRVTDENDRAPWQTLDLTFKMAQHDADTTGLELMEVSRDGVLFSTIYGGGFSGTRPWKLMRDEFAYGLKPVEPKMMPRKPVKYVPPPPADPSKYVPAKRVNAAPNDYTFGPPDNSQ